jgi:uncharacterized protein
MKVLAVSDIEVGILQCSAIRERFKESRLLISCGDLPFDYLENIVNYLDIPFYFVFGNHVSRLEKGEKENSLVPWGATNLNERTFMDEVGLILAGVEGCLQYNYGPHQYSQTDMWLKIFGLIPRLAINRLRYGRYLDVFVTHAPPFGIHDQSDLPHRGIKAFRWFIKVFKPVYHLHGHIHIYNSKTTRETRFGDTRVLNVYGYRELDIHPRMPGSGNGA